MKQSLIILLLGITFFLFIKLPHISIRLSDTNIYFYTAYQLLSSQLLYKDIFFTNFPLFPYISSLYFIITSGDLKLFYTTALFEVVAVTFLVYFIVHQKTKNHIISVLSSLLYMFSAATIVTSDHQTGVFTASIFILTSYIFLDKKNFLISGIFSGLALMTKAYFSPIILSFIIYLLFVKKNYKHSFIFLAGLTAITGAIAMPFLIHSPKEFITDVFYSATRGGGDKPYTLWFFIQSDFILFAVLLFNLVNFKKNKLFSIISLMSIVFLIFYQGLYYIYLNFIIPFLAISFHNLSEFLTYKRPLVKKALPIIIFFAIIINSYMYLKHFAGKEVINNIDSIADLVRRSEPEFLYGTPDITPALAYLGRVNLLENIIDTNPITFRNKIFDSIELTQKAVNSRTIVVTRGSDKLTIDNSPINEIFDKNAILKFCKLIYSAPINTNEKSDTINLLKCY